MIIKSTLKPLPNSKPLKTLPNFTNLLHFAELFPKIDCCKVVMSCGMMRPHDKFGRMRGSWYDRQTWHNDWDDRGRRWNFILLAAQTVGHVGERLSGLAHFVMWLREPWQKWPLTSFESFVCLIL